MKMTLVVGAATAFLVAAIAVHHAPTAAAKSDDKAAITKRIDEWKAQMRARDLDGVMTMYAAEVVAFDVVPPLEFRGADAYRKSYQNFMDTYAGPIETEVRDFDVVVSGDLAVSRGFTRFTGKEKASGAESTVWVRVTESWRRKNGQWRIIHEHVSVPVDFATGKAVLDLKP